MRRYVSVDISIDEVLDELSTGEMNDLRKELDRRERKSAKAMQEGRTYELFAKTMVDTQIIELLKRLMVSPTTDKIKLLSQLESI